MTILSRDPSPILDLSSASARQCVANVWFGDHFGAALPRGLRERADAMSWDSFVATYGHTAGPLRLGHWACTDAERPAGRLGPQARNFRAMIAVGDHVSTSTAAASGPIAAAHRDAARPRDRHRDTEVPSAAIWREYRHLHLRQQWDPRRVGDGLGGRSDAVRAARGDRMR